MNHYRMNVQKKRDFMFYLRHFSRIAMGVLFIFSGYVKMVDPYGFSLKIEEYFISFGMDFMAPTSMFFAFLAILAEFVLGWALLFGIQMQLAAWGLLLFMAFFTVLTFWLAYALDIVGLVNKLFGTEFQIFVVTDCGCFGDFVKLSNHETFYKNVIFMVFSLIIFAQRNKYKKQKWYYITQWFPILLVTAFSLFVMIYCLRHEPWHDFRPWKKGNFIAAKTYSEAPEMDFVFQYQNKHDGAIKEITIDELSEIAEDSLLNADLEENYEFVKRTEKMIKKGIDAELFDFTLKDASGTIDLKEEVIQQHGYHFILFIRDAESTTPNNICLDCVKTFARNSEQHSIPFIAVTSLLPSEVEVLEERFNHQFDFPFYYSDATPLKTALRSEIGLILLCDGYVMDKWACIDIPSFEEFEKNILNYNVKLEKYKKKNPPILPNGENLDEMEENEISEEPIIENE